ncbi:uncharacterized protein PG998_001807 [Apiospora kogelbergensis]|uniref:uncharacterized protein n=1 Tax=Apiospora kogelbergensis TaxID=1337665 RepID=UPI00312DFFEA
MAPVPNLHPPSYVPLGVAVSHLGLVVYLTYAVGASLYTSYKSLSPSQDTRRRLSRRAKLAPVFLGLAATALSWAAYSTVRYATLSYRAWADHRGYALPQRLFGNQGLTPGFNNSSELYLAHWLNDTPVYFDAYEIVAEKARRFWWGQQVDLATVALGMLLAIEGRRKRIPMLPAFMALAHLVNLSFAQNLFYLALLLTPTPIPSGESHVELPVTPVPASIWTRFHRYFFPPKPNNWCPHPAVFLTGLAVNLAAIGLLPHAAETPSFVKVALVSRLATFLPLLLSKIIPQNWGTVHPHPHNTHSSFTALFRFLSAASFFLHAKATFYGLRYNMPNSHHHRHSRFIPWDVEERSAWERSSTALGKVLGSISDHPAVMAVGWDALICVASLGVWAAVRATDVEAIIKSTVPYYGTEVAEALSSSKEPDSHETMIKAEPEADEGSELEASSTAVYRGGRAQRRLASIASSSGASDDISASTPRKRGRANRQLAEEEEAYRPSAEEAREVVEGDILPPEEPDWESASLSWGLAAIGGLGCASAGVFGGESISR